MNMNLTLILGTLIEGEKIRISQLKYQSVPPRGCFFHLIMIKVHMKLTNLVTNPTIGGAF